MPGALCGTGVAVDEEADAELEELVLDVSGAVESVLDTSEFAAITPVRGVTAAEGAALPCDPPPHPVNTPERINDPVTMTEYSETVVFFMCPPPRQNPFASRRTSRGFRGGIARPTVAGGLSV